MTHTPDEKIRDRWLVTRLPVACALAAVFVAFAACAPAEVAEAPPPESEAAVDSTPAGAAPASGLPTASPDTVGMSADGLARIEPAVQAYVDDGRLAGVMTMVARRGQVVHWAAAGMRDLDAGDPLERDDIFRIYSMTKPITSTGVMILVEEGAVALDDPVSKFIPEFADVEVLDDAGERVAPGGPMTVEHLLTHTSGLTYGFFGDSPVDRLYNESGFFTQSVGLEDFGQRVAALPLLASPGERWNYSVSTDILGRVIEVASGQSFDTFLQERIFDPLGMEDTGFMVPAEDRRRFTANYASPDGALQMIDSPDDGQYTRPPAWVSGGGGLASTASDYIRFAQMLLEDGALGDVRILAPETVAMMRSNRLPDAMVPIQLGTYLSPGYGFGLGFAVAVDAEGTPEPDNNGVFRWAGAANTFFWIDPEDELIGMVWTQFNPFSAYGLEREFQTLVYEAIE
ncbi:MAG: beta-lactamase family protein [Acidobacteria bacterium]|nr:beta-lactamase family protein [Acidobacteriota bacterium]MYJ04804.1 beta-lactamase family protein [Acidobacteriota bacterium]